MKLFSKREAQPETTAFDPALYEPVIRASICTGERVACMREKESGRLHELMLIRTDADLAAFCRRYRVEAGQIPTVY